MKNNLKGQKNNENQIKDANLEPHKAKPQNKITKLPLCLNRESIRSKWKSLMKQKMHKVFIKGANDVNILSQKYLAYFLLKQRIFFKIWKNHKLWRHFSAKTLLQSRVNNIKEASLQTIPQVWKKFVIKSHNEIKCDNFIDALSEYQTNKLVEQSFSMWKEAHFDNLSFRKQMRETWKRFYNQMKEIDFEEKAQEGKDTLQRLDTWIYFANQTKHNVYIDNLMNARDKLLFHRKWKLFYRQYKHINFEMSLQNAHMRFTEQRMWIDLTNRYVYETKIQLLNDEKEKLTKAMKLFDIIADYISLSRRREFAEAKMSLNEKRENNALNKYFKKWIIAEKTAQTIKRVSKTSFESSMTEYTKSMMNNNALKIQRWFRRMIDQKIEGKSLLQKYFYMWRSHIIKIWPNPFPELEDTIDYSPNIDFNIPIGFPNVSFDPIRSLLDFSLARKEKTVLKPFEYEDAPSRFSFLIPYECVDLINTFAPTDVCSIVSNAIKHLDIIGPFPAEEIDDEEQSKNEKFNMSDDFFVALSHSDFGMSPHDEEESSILATNTTNAKPSVIESFGFSFETDSMIQDNTELLVNSQHHEESPNEEESGHKEEESSMDSEDSANAFVYDNTMLNTSLTTTMNIEVVNMIQNRITSFDMLYEKPNIPDEIKPQEKPIFYQNRNIPDENREKEIQQVLSPLPYSYESMRRVSFPNLPQSSETSSEYVSYDQTNQSDNNNKQEPNQSIEVQPTAHNDPYNINMIQNELQHENNNEDDKNDSFEIIDIDESILNELSNKNNFSIQSFNQIDEAPQINEEQNQETTPKQDVIPMDFDSFNAYNENQNDEEIQTNDDENGGNTLEYLVQMAQQIFKNDERALRQNSSSTSESSSGSQTPTKETTTSSDYSSHHITIDESFLEYAKEGEEKLKEAKEIEVDLFDPFEMAFTATIYTLSDSLVSKHVGSIDFGQQLTSEEKYFLQVESSSDSDTKDKGTVQKIKQTVDTETYETVEQSKEPESPCFSLQIPSQETATIPQPHNIDLSFLHGSSNQYNDAEISPPSKSVADVSKDPIKSLHSLVKAPPTRVVTKNSSMMSPKQDSSVSSSAINSHEISKEDINNNESAIDSFLAPGDNEIGNEEKIDIKNNDSDKTASKEENNENTKANENDNIKKVQEEERVDEKEKQKENSTKEHSTKEESDNNQIKVREETLESTSKEEKSSSIPPIPEISDSNENVENQSVSSKAENQTDSHETEKTKEEETKQKKQSKKKKGAKKKHSKKQKTVSIEKVAPTFPASLTKCILPAVTIAIKKSLLFDIFGQPGTLSEESYSYDYSTYTQKDDNNTKQSAASSLSQDLHYDESMSDKNDTKDRDVPTTPKHNGSNYYPKYRVDSPIAEGPPITDYSTYENDTTRSTRQDENKNLIQSTGDAIEDSTYSSGSYYEDGSSYSSSESDGKPEKQTVQEEVNRISIVEPPAKTSKKTNSFVDGLMGAIDEVVGRIMPTYADLRFGGLSHVFDRSTPSIYESALANLSPSITSKLTPKSAHKSTIHTRTPRGGDRTITTTISTENEDKSATVTTDNENSRSFTSKQRPSAMKKKENEKKDNSAFHLRITKGISKEIVGIITESISHAVTLSIPSLVSTVGEIDNSKQLKYGENDSTSSNRRRSPLAKNAQINSKSHKTKPKTPLIPNSTFDQIIQSASEQSIKYSIPQFLA